MVPPTATPPPLDDPPAVLAAARAADGEDRLGEADKLLAEGMQRFPQALDLKIERAKLWTRLGKEREAIGLLNSLPQDNPRYLNLLGYTELVAGEREAGRRHLEQAIGKSDALGQPYAPPHYHLGLYWLAQGDLTAARTSFQRAQEINPDHLEASYQLANVVERLRLDPAAAQAQFARLYEPILRSAGAFDEPSTASGPIEHSTDVEWRPAVQETTFRRTFPAGSVIETACRVARGDPAYFSANVVDGAGRGAVLLEAIHAIRSDADASWIPHFLELPPGPAGAEQTVEFRVGPTGRWARWFDRPAPPDARFAEPFALRRAEQRSQDPQPNILLISLDTLRADRLGCYGAGRNTSPAIDALAASGVRFARAEAASNWTLPAHYSLFSGLAPLAHGVLPDLETTRGYIFPDRKLAVRGTGRERMLAEALASRGYRTAAITENAWVSSRFGFDQGFRLYRSDLRGSLTSTRDAALEQLEATGKQGPWFLFVHTYTPHQPYHAPLAERTLFASRTTPGFAWPGAQVPIKDYYRFRLSLFPPSLADIQSFRDLYDGQIHYADQLVGALVGWLEQRGLREQTIVAVVSDHGEEIFERGQFDHGDTLYEEVTRVPLVLSAPGRLPPGRVVLPAVSLIDLPATLLQLAGAGSRHGQGESLLPLVSDSTAASRPVFSDAIGRGGEALGAVWSGTLKYLRRETKQAVREWLFDWAADPGERVDLAPRRAADLVRLRALYTAHGTASAKIKAELGTAAEELDPETIERLKSLGYAQ